MRRRPRLLKLEPFSITSPLSGLRRPDMTFSSVVFPEPVIEMSSLTDAPQPQSFNPLYTGNP